MEPEWSQNRTQDGPKSKTKTKSKKEALEDRLGAVLGRSWLVLGAVLGSKSCSRLGWRSFFENRLFEENDGSRGDLGRFGVDLGRPGGVPNERRGGSEEELS